MFVLCWLCVVECCCLSLFVMVRCVVCVACYVLAVVCYVLYACVACFTSFCYYIWFSSLLCVVCYCGLFVFMCVAWGVLWIVVMCGLSCVLLIVC